MAKSYLLITFNFSKDSQYISNVNNLIKFVTTVVYFCVWDLYNVPAIEGFNCNFELVLYVLIKILVTFLTRKTYPLVFDLYRMRFKNGNDWTTKVITILTNAGFNYTWVNLNIHRT